MNARARGEEREIEGGREREGEIGREIEKWRDLGARKEIDGESVKER